MAVAVVGLCLSKLVAILYWKPMPPYQLTAVQEYRGDLLMELVVPEEPFVLKQPNSRILAEWKLSGEMQMEAEAQVVVEESLS